MQVCADLGGGGEGNFFCIFLKIAAFCKGSLVCQLPVRLFLGITELPQAITEMGP